MTKKTPEKALEKLPPNSWKIKYKPEFCEKLIAHRKQGKTMDSFVAVVGVTKQTLDNWRKNYPEFAEAWELGNGHAHYWWEEFGIAACTEKHFNPTWAMFLSRNMIGYKNLENRKPGEMDEPEKKLTTEEKEQKIKALQEQIAKFKRIKS